jgi:hypothetical protein
MMLHLIRHVAQEELALWILLQNPELRFSFRFGVTAQGL